MNHSTAKRALLVLEHLAGRTDGVMLTELGDALGLSKGAAHRLLALLEEEGFVQQDPATDRYALTLKLTMLGLQHYVRSGLDDLVQPVLDSLAVESGELARLAVADGDRLVWVAKAQGARSGLRYDPDVDHDTGNHVILHATATGKAWLATMPDADALRIVAATGFATPDRFGPRVARTLEAFHALLRETRQKGYGEAVEEGEPGTAAVAVAVHDATDDAAASSRQAGSVRSVATLSLAGPLHRFSPERRAELARRLKAAARDLGAIWPLRRPGGVSAARASTPRRERDHEPRRAAV